jgi:cadherin 23
LRSLNLYNKLNITDDIVLQTKDEYAIVLTLTDGKLGEGNFITQSLLILVDDVNDNVPVFRPHPTSLTLPENANPGVLVTVEATDLDEGVHGQVVYYLQELDGDNGVFAISTVNGKGIVRLVGRLDYEKKYLYQLRILAVDRAINEKVGRFLKSDKATHYLHYV